MTLSFPIGPMKATLGSLPAPADDENWAYELKWDGYRTLVFVDAGTVRVQSSSGRDVTASYPELAAIGPAINGASTILDGEIVVFGDDDRPNFGLLQRHERPVVFQAFDVLEIGGTETISLPYEDRRQLLTSVIENGAGWTVPAHRVGGGADLLAATAARELEGVMAKRLGSPYQVGKRSPNWRKVKNRIRTDVVVGGFSPGTGNRSSTFGSLLVGVPDPDTGDLRFAGGVGTGFTAGVLDEMLGQLKALRSETCPFEPQPPRQYSRGAVWVRPELVATIEIAEFTNDGYVRHASFIGLSG